MSDRHPKSGICHSVRGKFFFPSPFING